MVHLLNNLQKDKKWQDKSLLGSKGVPLHYLHWANVVWPLTFSRFGVKFTKNGLILTYDLAPGTDGVSITPNIQGVIFSSTTSQISHLMHAENLIFTFVELLYFGRTFIMTGVPKSKYFHPLASKKFPINICLFVAETLVYKYTTLFGRVWNGCSHDFKFAETCSNFCTILYSKTKLSSANQRWIGREVAWAQFSSHLWDRHNFRWQHPHSWSVFMLT